MYELVTKTKANEMYSAFADIIACLNPLTNALLLLNFDYKIKNGKSVVSE